jgi:alkaline phosphatase D
MPHFIKHRRMDNVVWLPADVHDCAAQYDDPTHALFQDLTPFWACVAGPLKAGTVGPNALDNTYGPHVIFQKAPAPGQANVSPYAALQFLGHVDRDGRSPTMGVSVKDMVGTRLFRQELRPWAPAHRHFPL